jgi:hypothetical protein
MISPAFSVMRRGKKSVQNSRGDSRRCISPITGLKTTKTPVRAGTLHRRLFNLRCAAAACDGLLIAACELPSAHGAARAHGIHSRGACVGRSDQGSDNERRLHQTDCCDVLPESNLPLLPSISTVDPVK